MHTFACVEDLGTRLLTSSITWGTIVSLSVLDTRARERCHVYLTVAMSVFRLQEG